MKFSGGNTVLRFHRAPKDWISDPEFGDLSTHCTKVSQGTKGLDSEEGT